MRMRYPILICVSCLWISAGCAPPSSSTPTAQQSSSTTATENAVADEAGEPSTNKTTRIEPGPDAQTQAQEALILAEPGDVIEFAEGTFEFNGTLSLDGINDITLRGKGMDKTILNFSGQRVGSGGEGLKIKADNFIIEDLTLQNSPGDAIKLEDSRHATIRRVRTWWSNGPDEKNGAYGIYPVLCEDVLIEHCVAECASDAGIYVGQTKRAIVRHNRAERNVAGIEIENTEGADVYENLATNNTGGILVFSLPGLKLKNGSHCRVYNNKMRDNNHPNFAQPGAMVAAVPPGTGLMIMANDQVEVFDNEIGGNQTANCAVISFLSTNRPFDDPQYDPFPEGIYIHDNKFSEGGQDPQGQIGKIYRDAAELPMPDIVVDGVVHQENLVDGRPPADARIYVTNNGSATIVDLGLAAVAAGQPPEFSTDLAAFAGKLPALEPIIFQEAAR